MNGKKHELKEKNSAPENSAEDFSQNYIGWTRIKVTKAKAGTCEQENGGKHICYGKAKNENVVGGFQQLSVKDKH